MSITAHAQWGESVDTTHQRHLFIAAELGGVTAYPLSTIFIKNKNSHSRLMGKIQYMNNNNFAMDMVVGRDRLEWDTIRTNFTNFTSQAEYLQLIFNYVPSVPEDRMRVLLGMGVTLGRLNESGVISIGDDYFNNFQEELIIDEKFIGWIGSIKFDYQLNKHFSCVIDTKMQAVNIPVRASLQSIYSNPGAGKSWLYSEENAFGIYATVWLKYRLF